MAGLRMSVGHAAVYRLLPPRLMLAATTGIPDCFMSRTISRAESWALGKLSTQGAASRPQ